MEHAFPPVPGRVCGECRACCQFLKIDELQKPPNVLCQHWNGGCTIYDSRPMPCRQFYCGWRLFEQLHEGWRPDRSNVFLRLVPAGGGRLGVDVNLVGPLTADMTRDLLSYVGSLIAGGIETHLVLPGPPGHGAAKLLLNSGMQAAVQSLRYENVLSAFEQAVLACQAFETSPATFGPETP